MIGCGWWNDDWWRAAVESGLMGIGNHSWDHNHDTLEERACPSARPGGFESVDDFACADLEIRQAAEYIRARAPNPASQLFAYPYGEFNEFLVERYFPERGDAIGIIAAFGDQARPVTEGESRWALPRFIFGRDWKSPDELRKILVE